MKRGIGEALTMVMAMEKKKKRTRGNYNNSEGEGREVYSAAAAAQVVLLHDDFVAEELLTRLPAKSLMRFKCVSKLWLSTIVDPAFCKAHRVRSFAPGRTGLLIVSPETEEQQQQQGLGFYLAIPSHHRVVSPSSDNNVNLSPPLLDKSRYNDVFDLLHHQFTLSNHGVTEVAGHLVCLYTANRAWLCSVSTGEIIQLPPPPRPPFPFSHHNNAAAANYKYCLGYDYFTKRFKVLRVFSIQGALVCISKCHILTLGGGEGEDEASWRWLHGVPPIHITGGSNNDNSVYINRVRHWWHSSGCFLVRFCFRDEKFLLIDLPTGFTPLGGSLHEFRGLVTLVTGVVDRKLHMWVLDRNCHDEDLEEWSGLALHIPYAFADHGCCLLGNLPTGLMLMAGTTVEQEDQQQQQRQLKEEEGYNSKSTFKATLPIYSYNHALGEFDEFVIGNPFWSTSLVRKDMSKLRIYSYAEDIRPLNLFINNPSGTRRMDDHS